MEISAELVVAIQGFLAALLSWGAVVLRRALNANTRDVLALLAEHVRHDTEFQAQTIAVQRRMESQLSKLAEAAA